MILLSITMTRRADVHWLAHETGRFFPEQWARFRDARPGGRSGRRPRRGLRPAAERHGRSRRSHPGLARLDGLGGRDPVARGGLRGPASALGRRAVSDRVRAPRHPLLRARGLARGGRAAAQRAQSGRDPGRPAPRPAGPVRAARRRVAARPGVARLGAPLHPGRPHRRRGDGPPLLEATTASRADRRPTGRYVAVPVAPHGGASRVGPRQIGGPSRPSDSAIRAAPRDDDFVQVWPQSGERLSKEASLKLAAKYPEMSGTRRSSSPAGCSAAATCSCSRATIDYGDGIPVRYVGVERGPRGQGRAMTEYFANPFEAPAWRRGIRGDDRSPSAV